MGERTMKGNMLKKLLSGALFAGFVGTVFGANWAIKEYGLVGVGFDLMAPAGVFFAGLAFTFRDLLHKVAGRWAVLGAIATGAAASLYVEPSGQLALASGVAFTVSEMADLAVYEPLSKKSWLGSVFASNSVGLVIDSALFLWLAFGSLEFIQGQIVGKAYMTLAAIALLGVGRLAVNAVLSRNTSPALAKVS